MSRVPMPPPDAAPDAAADALSRVAQNLRLTTPRPIQGRVVRTVGNLVRAHLPEARLGEVYSLECGGNRSLLSEVVSLDNDEAMLAPIGDMHGLGAGSAAKRVSSAFTAPVGDVLLGRVLDGLGRPLDHAEMGPLPKNVERRPSRAEPPQPLRRAKVAEPMPTGIRAIDGLLTCGEGQRIGVYGEPGAGKSTLLGQLLRGAAADVVVVALVGERGREVREFIDQHMNEAWRDRSVLVVATSDRPALERIKAAATATTIAEYFRDRGQRVLLVVDSVTRYARALREVGLAAGEPPTRRGFPPSVLTELPRLMERAGPGVRGSITAFYTVLLEGDGAGDPIAEETRSILDGHIMLSPSLAASGQFPAIDVLASVSRVANAVTTPEHRKQAARVRDLMHRHAEIEFLVQIGDYKPGVDARSDEALARIDDIHAFLRQDMHEPSSFEDTAAWLAQLSS